MGGTRGVNGPTWQQQGTPLTGENSMTVRNLAKGVAPTCSPCPPASSGEAGWGGGHRSMLAGVNGGTAELPGGAPVFSCHGKARQGVH
jgi:hypothetical protein